MQQYTVTSLDEAQDQLAWIWLNASDRREVTQASASIDALLAHDPLTNGQLISEGLYKLDVPPLYAYYTIDEDNRSVQIEMMKLTR